MEEFWKVVEYLRDFNIWSIVIRLFLAVALSGMIGMERSKSNRAAGLRTHILVCLGATMASMTGLYINKYCGGSGDVTRIAAQVISGIGFLGAGTILVKNQATIIGLTTAACVWTVGAIGIAVGYGFYEAAIIGTFLIFFITKNLSILDKKLRHNMKEISVYIEFINAKQLNATLTAIKDIGIVIDRIHIEKSKTNLPEGIGAEVTLHFKNKDADTIVEQLNQIENVNFAIITEQ